MSGARTRTAISLGDAQQGAVSLTLQSSASERWLSSRPRLLKNASTRLAAPFTLPHSYSCAQPACLLNELSRLMGRYSEARAASLLPAAGERRLQLIQIAQSARPHPSVLIHLVSSGSNDLDQLCIHPTQYKPKVSSDLTKFVSTGMKTET